MHGGGKILGGDELGILQRQHRKGWQSGRTHAHTWLCLVVPRVPASAEVSWRGNSALAGLGRLQMATVDHLKLLLLSSF